MRKKKKAASWPRTEVFLSSYINNDAAGRVFKAYSAFDRRGLARY